MTVLKKLTAWALALILLFPVVPCRAAEESTDELVKQLINYYHHYQGDARLDYEFILDEMAAQDPALASTWADILEFWINVNDGMEFHPNVLPDGLPEDDSLCIVVMGFQLNADGSMRSELYMRMKVALASAEKYPNAYIMCSGGGTAADDPKMTEAKQMAKWLRERGVSSDRIIVENLALSTIENAKFGCKLLYQNYPQVKNLAVITSDYHIYRSCFYMNTHAALQAYDAGLESMKVVAAATCAVQPNASNNVSQQVEGAGIITGLAVKYLPQPPLTQLEQITVAGQSEYSPGSALNLTVTAHYSNGKTRDVTETSELSGFDPNVSGFQTVTARYLLGEEPFEAIFDVYVIPPETVPTEPATEALAEPVTEPVAEPESPEAKLPIAFYIAGGCMILLIILLYLKASQAKKRRRRCRPTMNLD